METLHIAAGLGLALFDSVPKVLMKNLFKRWLKPPPAESEIKVRMVASNTLTLKQWQASPVLIESAMKLGRDANFQMARSVLENEHPRHWVFAIFGVSPNDRIVHQAKIEGYELALNNLDALSKSQKNSKMLVATFEPPEKQA